MEHLRKHTILLSAFLAIFFSCSRRPEGRAVGEGMVFRYNEAVNITSLDPLYARNQANIWATSQIFNGLLQLDQNLGIQPAIAKRFEVSSDGLVYTFILRDDIFFHDDACFPDSKGRRVTASDFVFSFSRLLDPQLNAPGFWVMNSVKRRADGSPAVTAISDTLLEIRLSQPFPAFPGLLSMQYTSVVPFEAVESYGAHFRSNPVGTGPFRFGYWKEGVKLILLKNENYFEFEGEKRLPYLDAVSISFIIDRQTAFLEFIKGNLDFLSSVDASYKDELLTPEGTLQSHYAGRFKMITRPFLNTEYLGILVDEQSLPANWPLLEEKIRRAINLGFDRGKMVRYLRNNIGIPAHAGVIPMGMPGFISNEGGYDYDPDQARQLLAEAGFPGGEGLPRLTLHTNQNYLDISQYIQYELSKIGISLAIDVMPPATLREMMAKGEARMFRASWIADYPDAENYLALFYSKNHAPAGPNFTCFYDERFDKLYEHALLIANDSLRQVLYWEMDKILIDKAPVVFLFYDQSIRFVPLELEGMDNNPLNHLDLKRVWFNRTAAF